MKGIVTEATREEKIDIYKRWIEALRGGRYKQAPGLLAAKYPSDKDFSYCCVGVLCDVVEHPYDTIKYEDKIVKQYRWSLAHLPPELRDRLGLDSCVTIDARGRTGIPINLIDLNDHRNLSFNQIADVIEYFLLNPLLNNNA